MEPTFPISYRAGWMEPTNEYIPEVIPPRPQWQTTTRSPDYGPIVEDDHLPSNPFNESTHASQKMQYTTPFPVESPITALIVLIQRYLVISSVSFVVRCSKSILLVRRE